MTTVRLIFIADQEASDPQPVTPDEHSEPLRYCSPFSVAAVDEISCPLRAALEASTLTYLSSHFHDGVCAVFATHGIPNQFVIQVVANKYNPSNFWWASE